MAIKPKTIMGTPRNQRAGDEGEAERSPDVSLIQPLPRGFADKKVGGSLVFNQLDRTKQFSSFSLHEKTNSLLQ